MTVLLLSVTHRILFVGRRATIVLRIIRAGLPFGEVPAAMAKEQFLHIRFTRKDKKRVEQAGSSQPPGHEHLGPHGCHAGRGARGEGAPRCSVLAPPGLAMPCEELAMRRARVTEGHNKSRQHCSFRSSL